MAILINSPTPSWSRVSKGSFSYIPLATYSFKNFPASSLEIPAPIWVKSFVPKEKNSAPASTILSATIVALGTSIMVPTL